MPTRYHMPRMCTPGLWENKVWMKPLFPHTASKNDARGDVKQMRHEKGVGKLLSLSFLQMCCFTTSVEGLYKGAQTLML